MKASRFNVFFKYEDGVILGYNSTTTGLIELGARDYDAYLELAQNKRPEFLAESEIAALKEKFAKGKFLIDDDVDELTQLKANYNVNRFLTKSVPLTIEVTHQCNLSCSYCYQQRSDDYLKDEMIPAIVQFVQALIRERDAKTVNNTWYGGEPLLNKEFLFALSDNLLSMCEKEKVDYSAGIITNGTLLTKEVAQRLKEHKVIDASITLDGPPDVHDKRRIYKNGKGSFWQILNNVKQALDFLKIKLRVNVDVDNVDYVARLLDVLEQEQLKDNIYVYFFPVTAYSSGSSKIAHKCISFEDFAPIQLALMKKTILRGFGVVKEACLPRPASINCGVLFPHSAIIDAKGMIQKCWEAVCVESEALGKITKMKTSEGKEEYRLALSKKDNRSKWLAFDPFSFEKCRGCELLPTCFAGCPWVVLGMNKKEPNCGTPKYQLKESLRLYREILELEETKKST